MADYQTASIRNIALVGHGSEGKTTLAEAMLYAAGHIDRQGRVEDVVNAISISNLLQHNWQCQVFF